MATSSGKFVTQAALGDVYCCASELPKCSVAGREGVVKVCLQVQAALNDLQLTLLGCCVLQQVLWQLCLR